MSYYVFLNIGSRGVDSLTSMLNYYYIVDIETVLYSDHRKLLKEV